MPNNGAEPIDNPEHMPLGEPEMGEPQDMSQDFGDNMGGVLLTMVTERVIQRLMISFQSLTLRSRLLS